MTEVMSPNDPELTDEEYFTRQAILKGTLLREIYILNDYIKHYAEANDMTVTYHKESVAEDTRYLEALKVAAEYFIGFDWETRT